jgi:NAD(P)-dependent dehydrogenase (short-subunit alcohol dehydrogenase family)
MKLHDAIVLITGANRGIGLAFAEAALARGARKVYAGARSPSSITTADVVPVKLDVTSDEDVAVAARICSDVTLVINNAGIARLGGLLNPEASAAARAQFDTNVFGILRMTQAFAPVLARGTAEVPSSMCYPPPAGSTAEPRPPTPSPRRPPGV